MSADEVSVVRLLWGDDRRAGDRLERELRRAEVAESARAKAGAAGSGVLDRRVSEVVRDAVDVDLGGIVITAWTGYRALREAAVRTRDTPGPPEEVELAEHEITSTHQPLVDILIDGARVQQLTFELVLTLTVRSVVAVVDRGELVAVRGGQVLASAALTLNGVTLAEGKQPWLPGAVVTLGTGIPLVGPAATTSTPANTTPTKTAAAPTGPAATSWVHQVSANTPPAPVPSPSTAPGVPWWEQTTPSGGAR